MRVKPTHCHQFISPTPPATEGEEDGMVSGISGEPSVHPLADPLTPSPQSNLVERLRARIEYLYDHSQCGKPDHILLTEAADALERMEKERDGETAIASGWHKRWKAIASRAQHPWYEATADERNNFDEVIHVLGVEDSEVTPAERAREWLAEIEAGRASIAALRAENESAKGLLRMAQTELNSLRERVKELEWALAEADEGLRFAHLYDHPKDA